jgi:hypothetical protein
MEKPFFLFYLITLPHGRHEIDDQGIYKDGEKHVTDGGMCLTGTECGPKLN